jgi:hypothetical protein
MTAKQINRFFLSCSGLILRFELRPFKPVFHRLIPVFPQPLDQLLYPACAQLQLLGGLPLRNVPLPYLMQGLQPVSFFPIQQ